MRKTRTRVFSILLTLCMVLSLLPATMVSVAAAETTGSDINDMTALDALGYDTSQAPEGYDANTTDNPYGRPDTTLEAVDELFWMGQQPNTNGASISLYGHDKALLGSLDSALSSSTNSTDVSSISGNFLMIEGNFSDDNNGQKAQAVYVELDSATDTGKGTNTFLNVGAGAAPASGQLVIKIVDTTSEGGSNATCQYLAAELAVDYMGNSADSAASVATGTTYTPGGVAYSRNFANAYAGQNYTKLAVGDFDGDGIDEIAVYVADNSRPRIEIYDLQKTDGDSYKEWDGSYNSYWSLAYSYVLPTYGKDAYGYNVVPNMVSLSAADYDRDGTDDLAISWGYFGKATQTASSKAAVLLGARSGDMLKSRIDLSLKVGTAELYRSSFTSGDADGDGYPELVLGGNLSTGSVNSRYVAVYDYDGDSKTFVRSQSKNFELYEKDSTSEQYVNEAMKGRTVGDYLSLPITPANVAVGQFLGVTGAPCIYLDSILIELGDNGLEIASMLDRDLIAAQGNATAYVEWGVRAADLTGSGTDIPILTRCDVGAQPSAVPGLSFASQMNDWLANTLTGWFANFYPQVTAVYAAGSSLTVKKWDASYKYQAFCLPNTDNDTIQLSYTGKHYYQYSDPKILAVLASPPYFKDLDNEELGGSAMESSTSYSTSKSSGSSSTTSATLSAGVYTSWEHSITVFGVEIGKSEGELSIKNNFTWESEQGSELEQSVTYSSLAGQDTVVFFSTPVETYVYNARVPKTDGKGNLIPGEYDEQEMAINFPHEAQVKNLPLDTYERIAADYEGLPQIADNVLSHATGMPATYPHSDAGYSQLAVSSLSNSGSVYMLPKLVYNSPSNVGYGESSQEQDITMTSESSNSFTYELEVECKAGIGTGGVMVGASVGTTIGTGTTKVTTSGSSYTGTVYSLPASAEAYGYDFNWRLMAYPYSDGTNIFPVVTYITTEVSQPPLLPDDLRQEEDGTTQNAISLEWENSGNPAGFVLYRYFRSAGAADFYDVAYISASDTDAIVSRDGNTRTYRYVDAGLSPDTEYQYRIQTIGNGQPNKSVQSATLTAYTKPDSGIPQVAIDKTSLTAYPDAPATATAYLTNSDELTGATIFYQWQKQSDSGTWASVTAATAATLRITNAGLTDEGLYRCRVTARQDQTMVTAYSPTLTVAYAKREAVLTNLSADKTAGTVSVNVVGQGTNVIPSGTVTFTLEGGGTTLRYESALDSAGLAYAKVNAPTGTVYRLSAVYNGNRVFRTAASTEEAFYNTSDQSGTFWSYSQNYTYGDDLNIFKYTVDASGAVTGSEALDYKALTGADIYVGMMMPVFGSDAQSGVFDYDDVSYQWYATNNGTNVTSQTLSAWASGMGTWINIAGYDNAEDAAAGQNLTATILKNFQSGKAAWTGQIKLAFDMDGNGSIADSEKIAFNVSPTPVTLSYQTGKTPITVTASQTNTLKDLLTPKKLMELTAGQTMFNDDLFYQSAYAGGLRLNVYDTAGNWVKGWTYQVSANNNPGTWAYSGGYDTLAPGAYAVRLQTYTPTLPYGPYGDTNRYYQMLMLTQFCYEITADEATLYVVGPAYAAACAAEQVDGRNAGTVEQLTPSDGKTSYPTGTTLVFGATPYDGYAVDHWTVNGTEVAGNTSNRLTLTQTTAGAVVKVYFKVRQNTITVTASPADAPADGATGQNTITCSQSVGSGSVVSAGAELTYTAHPAAGWHFTTWEYFPEGGKTVYSEEPSYSITMPDASVRLFGKFARDTYTLTLPQGLVAVDGSGAALDVTKPIVGDTAVTVKPAPGYELAAEPNWTATQGVTDTDSADGTFTFALTQNTEVSAAVAPGQYTVSLTAPENGTLAVTDASGSPVDLTQAIPGGTRLFFIAAADRGYAVSLWNGVNDGASSYILTVAGNETVSVTFAQMEHRDIALTADTHAAISCAVGDTDVAIQEGVATIYEGETLTVTAVPDSGYMMAGWTVTRDTTPAYESGTARTYTVPYSGSITALDAATQPISYNRVTFAASDSGGTLALTADGDTISDSPANLIGGSRLVFTATPDSGYRVFVWTVDGEDVEDNNAAVYTVDALDAPMDVQVAFIEDTAALYTVTVDSVEHGSVQYALSVGRPGGKAAAYDTVTLTANPNEGYQLDTLRAVYMVDGTPTDAEIAGSAFTMPAGDVTVTATFTPIPAQHEHAWASAWSSDASSHWHECTTDGCPITQNSAKDGYAAHISSDWIITTAATATTAGSQHKVCTVCGYELATEAIPATGSGSSSGGGAGGGAVTSAVTVPVTGDATVNVKATVSDGTAQITVSDSELNQALGSGSSVTIDVSALKTDAAQIPASAIRTVSAAEDAALTVKTISGTVTLDDATLTQLATQGGDVTVTVKQTNTSALTDEQKSMAGDRPVYDLTLTVNGKTISSFDGTVTVSLPYTLQADELANAVTVWFLANDGTLTAMNGVYDANTGMVTFTTNHFSAYVVGYFPFTDVAGNAWYYGDVAYAYLNGLFAGTGDNTFSPARTMTRGMIATVLWRMEGSPEVDGMYADFADVSQGSYYEAAIGWAAKNGIAGGYGEGMFGPDDAITREQMAAILYRYAQFKGIDVSVGEDTNILSYNDVAQVSEYAIPAMQWACGAGLLNGSENNLMPKDGATRAQVAAILHRFMENVVK